MKVLMDGASADTSEPLIVTGLTLSFDKVMNHTPANVPWTFICTFEEIQPIFYFVFIIRRKSNSDPSP